MTTSKAQFTTLWTFELGVDCSSACNSLSESDRRKARAIHENSPSSFSSETNIRNWSAVVSKAYWFRCLLPWMPRFLPMARLLLVYSCPGLCRDKPNKCLTKIRDRRSAMTKHRIKSDLKWLWAGQNSIYLWGREVRRVTCLQYLRKQK